jgi:hypothetical protein
LLIRFGSVRALAKPIQKHRLMANNLAQKMCVKTFFRRTVVQMWKAEPEYAGSRVQGEDCGNIVFVK